MNLKAISTRFSGGAKTFLVFAGIFATIDLATFLALRAAGVCVNTSPSMPAGIYIRSKQGPYAVACPPGPSLQLSSSRGYLPPGGAYWCEDGSMPLLKPIVAAGGDFVRVAEEGVSVNGRLLPNSAPRSGDSHGRPTEHYPYGDYSVPDGQVWLVSSYDPRSFDSRYFGPVIENSIKMRMRPLLVK